MAAHQRPSGASHTCAPINQRQLQHEDARSTGRTLTGFRSHPPRTPVGAVRATATYRMRLAFSCRSFCMRCFSSSIALMRAASASILARSTSAAYLHRNKNTTHVLQARLRLHMASQPADPSWVSHVLLLPLLSLNVDSLVQDLHLRLGYATGIQLVWSHDNACVRLRMHECTYAVRVHRDQQACASTN
jgi:hypothetical protein